jgi:hypothetical protein
LKQFEKDCLFYSSWFHFLLVSCYGRKKNDLIYSLVSWD